MRLKLVNCSVSVPRIAIVVVVVMVVVVVVTVIVAIIVLVVVLVCDSMAQASWEPLTNITSH